MPENDFIAYFYLLKDDVAQTYLSKKEMGNKRIHNWSVEDIKNFQDDLADTLNERLSERWFYTHLKPTVNEKLPRIDMLNILSRYIGYNNWEDFKTKQDLKSPSSYKRNKLIVIVGLVAAVVLVGAAYFFVSSPQPVESLINYRFCFYDADNHQEIDENIEMIIIRPNESPLSFNTDGTNCGQLITKENFVRFIVKAPYYKTDTIERKLPIQGFVEELELRRDDYALMIQYFATADVLDWEKRRSQLDDMISKEAVIFQISESNLGMEMYNKTDFINKLTTPLRSLGDIEIVETVYQDDKIISLRFIQI